MNVKDLVEEEYNKLNPEQKRAVKAIVKNWNEANSDEFVFPVVDGPPGTGKTHVGVIATAKYVMEREGRQVVYLCKTNSAAETARKMFYSKLRARSRLPGAPLEPDKLYVTRIVARGETDWESGVVDWRGRDLVEEIAIYEHQVILTTIDSARNASGVHTKPKIIIDEFSQVNPVDFFAAIERVTSRKSGDFAGIALLGDPIQLPVVTTQSTLRPNILTFIRTIVQPRSLPVHQLKAQYRMNKLICEAVNQIRTKSYFTYRLYPGKPEIGERTLRDFGFSLISQSVPQHIQEMLDPNAPLVLVDTSKLGDQELAPFGSSGVSVRNPSEAKLASQLAEYLIRNGMKNLKILSPYNAQVELIKLLLAKRLGLAPKDCGEWVTSIYRSQGQEWPCVIISFVRSNDAKNDLERWGFLGEENLKAQVYVGISRAQAKLIVLAAYDRTFNQHRDFDALWETPKAEKITAERSWV